MKGLRKPDPRTLGGGAEGIAGAEAVAAGADRRQGGELARAHERPACMPFTAGMLAALGDS